MSPRSFLLPGSRLTVLTAVAAFSLGLFSQPQAGGAVCDVVHSFAGATADGAMPFGPLLRAADGHLYGATSAGGSLGGGTIFKLAPNGSLTNLHNFAAASGGNLYVNEGGSIPRSGLIQAGDGNFYGTTYLGGSGGRGTVFKLTPAGVFTVLHNFSAFDEHTANPDGANPACVLVQGKDGNLYGTTAAGGIHATGTVFKITLAGDFTPLHAFPDAGTSTHNEEGLYPHAGLVQGGDNVFYGTASSGGAAGNGAVFRITSAGEFTILHSFAANTSFSINTDGSSILAPLIAGRDGNFYGTAANAGPKGGGTIFKITPAGTLRVLHAFTDVDDMASTEPRGPDSALLQGRDGSFYGVAGGGTGGSGVVYRLNAAGELTVLHDFEATDENSHNTDGSLPNGELIQDANGHFYGTTFEGGAAGSGTVFRITLTPPSIISAATATATAGTAFSYQIAASNSPARYGASGLPRGLAINQETGAISGTPTMAGTFTVTIAVFNESGSGAAKLTLTVKAPGKPTITSPLNPASRQGVPFLYQTTASNYPASYGAANLPAGLKIDQGTGKITGTPTVYGTFTPTIAAFNDAESGSAKLNLIVKQALPVITSNLNPPSRRGVAFAYEITATNNPTSYGASGLLSGLAINQTTGKISGVPTKAGTYTVTVAAFNSGGSGSAQLSLIVTQ